MRVLLIGATGMLGRPVARRLVREGFQVRAFVRDLERAGKVLPAECECIRGDLRDAAALDAALRGADAVYANLNTPFSAREAYDPDRDGTAALIAAAKRGGVRRVLRLSALMVPAARAEWWAIERKAATDEALMASGLDFTIFRPDWFLESLPLFFMGVFLVIPRTPATPLRWIAGDDYAAMVAAALRDERTVRRVYSVRGPELVTFRAALRRFARAWRRWPFVPVPLPRTMLRMNGLLVPQARYLADLLAVTFRYAPPPDDAGASSELPTPTMRVEDYARYIRETGDWPKK